jgi:hypothetical protein
MMPPTATYNDIKAYQDKVEKDKITPHRLPPCPRCHVEARFFKIHAYRERRFLIIVEVLIKAVFCTLVRFRCPDCGKTITCYPNFAIPHKHYTRQTIEGLSRAYVQNDQMSYQDAVMPDGAVPERPVTGQALAPSSLHRWISTLAELIRACFEAPGSIQLPERKYKTPKRWDCLILCRWFFKVPAIFRNLVFTEFAIRSA